MKKNKSIIELKEKKELLKKGGGEKATEKQHSKGKLTARERIELLVDPGTFQEYDLFVRTRSTYFGLDKRNIPADGVITGTGHINGRRVALYAQDFTVIGGSLGEMHALKIAKMQDLAMKLGIPIIGMNDSGGARIQEGIDSLQEVEVIISKHRNGPTGTVELMFELSTGIFTDK